MKAGRKEDEEMKMKEGKRRKKNEGRRRKMEEGREVNEGNKQSRKEKE